MKRIPLIALILVLIASGAAAAPLADYSAGKGSVDLTWHVSPKLETHYSNLGKFLPDSVNDKFSAGLTIGLGNNVAFQYKYHQGESDPLLGNTGPLGTYMWLPRVSPGAVRIHDISGLVFSKVRAEEYNLLYRLNPNLSVFAGATRVKGTVTWNGTVDYILGNGMHIYDPVVGSDADSVDGHQFGFIAATKLADKMTGWTTVGWGNKVESWEVGLSYQVADNVDLNLSYSGVKYKGLQTTILGNSIDYSLTTSGIGVGLTYKF